MSDDVDERPIMIDNSHHHPQQQPHQSHQPHPSHWDAVVLPPVPPRSNNPTQPQPPPPTASASAPALSTPAPGQHHPADSSRRHLSASRSSSSNHHGQHSSDPYPKSSNKGGVRGRVTVVCAECKRLKLRCSRDRPCTSCVKRACVDRCRYRNDEQPLATGSSGEHRSIIPSSAPGDAVYRLVSISCIQCTNNNSKCDRREACSHCIKYNVECVYPGLAPLAAPADANLIQTLSRLARLEARITELSVECDQCADLQLKCDGRAPCSWCVKRHSQAQSHQSHSGGVGRGSAQFDSASLGLPPLQPGVGAGIGCTYSGYSEQAQRQSLHSPQSSLHASTGSASRDRSPYALRISSPPPPNSSHSTTTTSGSNELHSRISAAENQVTQYMRTHSHSFSHGHSLSHGSSASMGSGVGFAGPGGGSTTSYNSTSTLTPITPSHPSSLHHYAVSGSGNLPHSSYPSHPPQHQHQHQHHHSTSSRHSPSQYSPGTNNHHPQTSPDQPQSNHHQSYHPQDSHRPRQPSLSNASVLLPPPNPNHPNHPNHPPSSTSPGPFAFGSSTSRHSKIPTPPGSGSSASAGAPPLPPPPAPAPINAAAAASAAAAAAANNAGTKLPEISNILTLLSPAPSSSTTESKTPHPLRTPVSGVTSSAGHGILNIGGASSIQHTQSDVRGTPTQRDSHEHLRRDSLSHSRGVLPSPSRSISPPHDQPRSHSTTSRHSPDSRPSSSENRRPNNPNKLAMYSPSQHRRGISGSYMDDNGGKLSAPSSHVRTFSGTSGIRGGMEEDDDRADMEVDEIDTDP